MALLNEMNQLHAEVVRPALLGWTAVIERARDNPDLSDREAIEAIPALEAIEKAAKMARETLRSKVADDMQENGVLSYQSTHYEAGLARAATTAQVTDEKALQTARPDLFEPQPDKLRRAELTKELKRGELVPGAVLSNGGPMHLVVRARKDLAK